jgi:hypothetical protein
LGNPDPVSANWRTERVGKPDSTAYIQNLINTNGIAELPEGVFYISSTLLLPIDNAAIASMEYKVKVLVKQLFVV